MKWDKEYDERQLKIRGDIYQRGFLMVVLGLVLNGALMQFGVQWASPLWSTLIIVMLVTAVISVEMIFRDAYIGVRSQYNAKITMLLFGLCALLNIGANAFALAAGDAFIENGILSMAGASMVLWSIHLSMPLALLCKKLIDRKKSKQEAEEEAKAQAT